MARDHGATGLNPRAAASAAPPRGARLGRRAARGRLRAAVAAPSIAAPGTRVNIEPEVLDGRQSARPSR